MTVMLRPSVAASAALAAAAAAASHDMVAILLTSPLLYWRSEAGPPWPSRHSAIAWSQSGAAAAETHDEGQPRTFSGIHENILSQKDTTTSEEQRRADDSEAKPLASSL